MWLWKIVSSILVFGLALFTHPNSETTITTGQPTLSPSASVIINSSPKITPPEVKSDQTVENKSNINIKVDDLFGKSSQKFIYPGATKITDNQYQTGEVGEIVYSWYKQELESKAFQIRNNVKTRANDQFKAVLQAISDSGEVVSVRIEQADKSSQTQIIF